MIWRPIAARVLNGGLVVQLRARPVEPPPNAEIVVGASEIREDGVQPVQPFRDAGRDGELSVGEKSYRDWSTAKPLPQRIKCNLACWPLPPLD